MQLEFGGELGRTPGAASEWGKTAAEGEIEALDEGCLDATGEAKGL